MPGPRPRGGWVNPYAPGNHITYITHPAGFRVLSGQAHTMQDGPVQDDARRSVESPVRETDQAADDAHRGVEPPVRAADQEYQDTLYSESEVQHCIERTDKNLMDMQECIEMLQMSFKNVSYPFCFPLLLSMYNMLYFVRACSSPRARL